MHTLEKVVEDMQRQVSAERKKRAAILDSEGVIKPPSLPAFHLP